MLAPVCTWYAATDGIGRDFHWLLSHSRSSLRVSVRVCARVTGQPSASPPILNFAAGLPVSKRLFAGLLQHMTATADASLGALVNKSALNIPL